MNNFEIEDYYKHQPLFHGVFSKNELPKKLKRGAYVVNMDDSDSIKGGTHWIAIIYLNKTKFYFDSYGVMPPLLKQVKIVNNN